MSGRLKLRDEIAERLFEDLIYKAADEELDALKIELKELREKLEFLNVPSVIVADIENDAVGYATTLAEAAFLAGLDCGSDLRRLVCKTGER